MTQKHRNFPQIVSLNLAIGQDYGKKSSECRNISIKAENKKGENVVRIEILTNYRLWSTIAKGVACKTLNATANRAVVYNTALGVITTQSWTRIDTFLVDAGLIRRTIRAQNALWSAIGCYSDHIGETAAQSLARNCLTLGIWSTRCRIARIRRQRSKCRFLNYRTRNRC